MPPNSSSNLILKQEKTLQINLELIQELRRYRDWFSKTSLGAFGKTHPIILISYLKEGLEKIDNILDKLEEINEEIKFKENN